jgi:CheY-like chemotaxis protein
MTSGVDALAILLESDFALVLFALDLPEMAGFEVALSIRARDRTQHVPIVLYARHRTRTLRAHLHGCSRARLGRAVSAHRERR